jgi:hypothetical protein
MNRETLRRWAPVALLLAIESILLWGDGALLIVVFAAAIVLFPALYADQVDEIAQQTRLDASRTGYQSFQRLESTNVSRRVSFQGRGRDLHVRRNRAPHFRHPGQGRHAARRDHRGPGA